MSKSSVGRPVIAAAASRTAAGMSSTAAAICCQGGEFEGPKLTTPVGGGGRYTRPTAFLPPPFVHLGARVCGQRGDGEDPGRLVGACRYAGCPVLKGLSCISAFPPNDSYAKYACCRRDSQR